MNINSPSAPRSPNVNDVRPFDASSSFVVLQNEALVHVDNDSLRDLAHRGLNGRWYAYTNGSGRWYVAMHRPASAGQGTTTIAALITQRGPDEEVVYRNGNRFDLRLANLVVRSKRIGKRRDPVNHAATMFPADPDRQAAWIDAEIERRSAQSRAARQAQAVHANTDDPAGLAGITGADGDSDTNQAYRDIGDEKLDAQCQSAQENVGNGRG